MTSPGSEIYHGFPSPITKFQTPEVFGVVPNLAPPVPSQPRHHGKERSPHCLLYGPPAGRNFTSVPPPANHPACPPPGVRASTAPCPAAQAHAAPSSTGLPHGHPAYLGIVGSARVSPVRKLWLLFQLHVPRPSSAGQTAQELCGNVYQIKQFWLAGGAENTFFIFLKSMKLFFK